MSKEQKKAQKKKDREKEVHKKVLARREELQKPVREQNAVRRKIKRVLKLKKDMGNLNVWADDVLLKMTGETLSQLEKNAKILKALEEEYKEEQAKKVTLNQELEKDGYLSLDEKMSHMHDDLVKRTMDFYEAGGLETRLVKDESAPKAEIAEVSVTKAPVEEPQSPEILTEN